MAARNHRRDPTRNQERILVAATEEFSRYGLGGARVDRIAARAGANKRMLYYYYGNKEALFLAVLESRYAHIRRAEQGLRLGDLDPAEGMRRLIAFTWNYYLKHPEFITLLNTENLHRGKHIAKSPRAREYSSPAIGVIVRVLQLGVERGLFRNDLAARDVYLMVAGLCYFYLSNRYTLSAFLGENLEAPAALAHWVDTAVILGVVGINAVLGFLQEGKAERSLDAIRNMLSLKAIAVRGGQRIAVAAEAKMLERVKAGEGVAVFREGSGAIHKIGPGKLDPGNL